MRFLKLYGRMLRLLGSDWKVAVLLCFGAVMVAGLQFLDPVLFGRVIGLLADSDQLRHDVLWQQATVLLSIWAGVGVAGIASNMATALQGERLAHRNRIKAIGRYYSHVLGLPLSFHGDIHSGRLMKVMITGTDGMFALWLVFFRDQLATIASVVVLLPLTLLMNWRLSICLFVLVIVFIAVTSFVIGRTQAGQRRAEGANSRLAGTVQDALGNIMVVQSFTRLAAERRLFGDIAQQVIANQFPVLNWWAVVNVLTRGASTLAVISIVVVGTMLHLRGEAEVGEIVSFMGFATPADRPAGGGGELRRQPVLPAPGDRGILRRAGREEFGAGSGGCPPPRRAARRGRVRGCRLRLSGRAEGAERRGVHRAAGHGGRAGRTHRRRQIDRHGAVATAVGSDRGPCADRRPGHRGTRRSRACAPRSAWCSRRACCSTGRSATICWSAARTRRRKRSSTPAAWPTRTTSSCASRGATTR